MEDTEILELIASRMEANREKGEKYQHLTCVNVPAIYAQAYEYLILEIEDEIGKRK